MYCGLPEDRFERRAHLVDQGIQRGGPALERAKRIGKFVNRGLAFARISVDLRNLAAALLPAGTEQLDFNSEELLRVSIPAANGMFGARSLARLYALLANGGDLRIVRIGNAAVRCAERR